MAQAPAGRVCYCAQPSLGPIGVNCHALVICAAVGAVSRAAGGQWGYRGRINGRTLWETAPVVSLEM
jgi:hypothetical protein